MQMASSVDRKRRVYRERICKTVADAAVYLQRNMQVGIAKCKHTVQYIHMYMSISAAYILVNYRA